MPVYRSGKLLQKFLDLRRDLDHNKYLLVFVDNFWSYPGNRPTVAARGFLPHGAKVRGAAPPTGNTHSRALNKLKIMKKSLGEMQTRKHCALAEPKIFAPPQTPFPGVRDGQNLITWRCSLPLPTNPVWWGSMHAISSYRGNRHTQHKHTHTNKQTWPITIHCAAAGAQCNQCCKCSAAGKGWSWLYRRKLQCASGCVVECRICNREVAGSNISLGYFAPRSTQPSIPPESVNEYQL